ncbi:hypothetical protein [uncultured Alistipes sp.]|uniref:hypothetical protein n=1 Tax=uncultured Alistipes sp. TaxID=538949 RepID=UPI0025DAF5B0|nr:hypothetical protein [uncultured Alistipes sp.]
MRRWLEMALRAALTGTVLAAAAEAYNGVKTEFRGKLARVEIFMDLWTGKNPKFLGEPVGIGK